MKVDESRWQKWKNIAEIAKMMKIREDKLQKMIEYIIKTSESGMKM